MKKLFVATLLIFAGLISVARADSIILVQGYLGNAGSWRASGISWLLQQHGWADGGHMSASPYGVMQWQLSRGEANRFYTIDLPTEAPITVQMQFLAGYIQQVMNRHRGEKIIVAGHSAGGVVARATMVSYPQLRVDTLITIASPHLGTGAAEDGLSLSNSPVGFFAPMFGAGTINRSRALYLQLVRERPGTFLGWLNRVKHPKANYVSIVRVDRGGLPGDRWVPGWSQDMNDVAALHGKAKTLFVPGPHQLTINDGLTILSVLKG